MDNKKKILHKLVFEDDKVLKSFPVYVLEEDEFTFKVCDLNGMEQTIGKRCLVRLCPIVDNKKEE